MDTVGKLRNPDQPAQNDLLNKLLAELTVERKVKQDMILAAYQGAFSLNPNLL